jgi:hypothetical protein
MYALIMIGIRIAACSKVLTSEVILDHPLKINDRRRNHLLGFAVLGVASPW